MWQEGSIVRCITRLDELCREARNAARIIGDPSLYRKMEQASESIKRDIVFAVRKGGRAGCWAMLCCGLCLRMRSVSFCRLTRKTHPPTHHTTPQGSLYLT